MSFFDFHDIAVLLDKCDEETIILRALCNNFIMLKNVTKKKFVDFPAIIYN